MMERVRKGLPLPMDKIKEWAGNIRKDSRIRGCRTGMCGPV